MRTTPLAALLALALIATPAARAALDPEESRAHDGQPAAAFALTSLDGKPVSLAALKGKPALLLFFGTYCPPCHEQTEQLKALVKQHGAALNVVGAVVDKFEVPTTKPDEEKKDAADFVKEMSPGYPVVIADPALVKGYGFTGIPTTVVIGPDGKIARTFLGFHKAEKIEAVIRPLLGGAHSR